MRIALLLLAACAPDAGGPGTCDAETENCCTGTIDAATVEGLVLSVRGGVECSPQDVAQWTLYIDGVTATSGPGTAPRADIAIDLDLRPFDLAEGDHTLSLWAIPAADANFLALDETTITVAPDRPDDTGDTQDTGDTTIDTEETGDTGPALVDLTVSTATLDVETGVPGTPLSVDLTVANLGNTPSDAVVTAWWSTDALFDTSDAELATLSLGFVSGGDARESGMLLDVPGDATPGTRYILLTVDAAEDDVDPTNDLLALDFNVEGPALEADTFNVAPAFGIPGDVLAATWRARNSGSVAAGPVVLQLLWSNDALVDKDDVVLSAWTESGLTAYGSSSGTVDITLPDGPSGHVIFVVDADDAEPEADESDNSTSASVEVFDIDLSAMFTTLGDTSVSLGDRLDADVTVTNAGSSDASGFNVTLWLSSDAVFDAGDTLFATSAAGTVAAGTSTTISLSGTVPDDAPVGGINIFAVVDAEGYVREQNESNNTDNLDLDVSAPDLVPDINGVSSTTISVGASFTADVRIGNWTSVGTTLPLEANLYLSTDSTWDASDTLLSAFTLPPATAWDVGSAQTTSATIPTSAALGAAWLIAYADPSDKVSETDEANNAAAYAVTLR